MSTAVILAGGKSRRMHRDKLELRLENLTLLESAVARFSAEFDQVFISVAEIDKYPAIKVGRIMDVYPDCGPLGGLHAALSQVDDEGVFLVAADMPYAAPGAAKKIMELTAQSEIGILRYHTDKFEPLFAYYRKSVLPYAEKLLSQGKRRPVELLKDASVRYIDPAELGALWDERILSNVNTPEDYGNLLSR